MCLILESTLRWCSAQVIKGEKSQENSSYKLVAAVPKLSSMQNPKWDGVGVKAIVCTTQAARALAVFVGKESQQDHSQ